ncbi:MAG: sulfatase [Planctomycetaceae bacterium]|nr:sulfatase [Planctomycetaceae bacterium]
MRRHSTLLAVTIAFFIVAGSSILATAEEKNQRPNILFIMADDHTSQAIGAYGGHLSTFNPTPTIDTLARNGMRFERVFCNNSICTPSRASIITGQYSQTNGVLDLRGNIPPKRQFLAHEMKEAGYQTAMIGKWHLKQEPAAFDYYCVLPGQGRYYDPSFRIQGDKPWPQNVIKKEGMHSSDAITDISLKWLKSVRDADKPFFLMHHFKAPHDMFKNAERYDDYLEEIEIPAPANLFDPPDGSVGSRGFGSGLGLREHAPWKLGKRLGIPENLEERVYVEVCYQNYLKRYLRCVKGVDDNVKRILDYLKESGELDNTIIFYTGDQGFFLGEHDLMDKRWMYEEAMRMPFIVHWPNGIKPGQINDWLINNTDFAPTILELAGVKPPDYMQGRSFASALQGKPKPDNWRQVTYYRYWMHLAHSLAVPAHFGVRSERYKLIFFYGINENQPDKDRTPAAWEFYDLEHDPHEMQNRYDDPAYQKTIAEMKRQLRETRQELNETDANYPEIQKVIEAHWNK